MKKTLTLLGILVFGFSLVGCNTEHKHTLIQHEAKQATCTEDGHNAYEECTECDYTTYVKIEKLGHDFDDTKWETDELNHWHICKNEGCNATDTKGPHTPNQEEATIYESKYCTVCNYMIEAQLEHTHSYTKFGSDEHQHWLECVCGEIDPNGVKTQHSAVDDNNCLTADICECGYTVTPAKDHTYNDDYDCTTELKCEDCGTIIIEANSHNFTGDWVIEEDGHYHECQKDNCTVKDKKLDHIVISSCIGTICNICGYKDSGSINKNIHVSYDENTGNCECGEVITPQAQVGAYFYGDFNVALENWVDGTTLTLLTDITGLTESIKTKAKGLVLDLNGHRLESSDSNTIWIDGDSKSELTIRDSKGNGYIKGDVCAVGVGSKLCLESGTIERVIANGDFTMTGGSIDCDGVSAALTINSNVDVRILGGEIIGTTGIWNSYGNVIISGSPKIVGTDAYAIRNFENLSISGTPNLSGTTGEIITSNKITLDTQPTGGNQWRIAIDTNYTTDRIFAVPGENVEFDINKFESTMEGYEVKVNNKGELLLCNHATSYHTISNGNGTHNKSCHCENTILETNIPCTGGIATDTHLAICEYCGNTYGELDPNNHYDIDAVNMDADELYNAVLELILSGDTDISIFFGDITTEMYEAIDKAISDSNAEEDSINITLNGLTGVQNEEQLVNAVKKGGTILITGDIELSELNVFGIVITKDTTIILNGYTITGVYGTFYVEGATLTILGEGTLTMVEENKDVGFTIDVTNGGVLNLQNGTVEGWLNASYGGTANINGGFVEILSCGDGTINITNGSIENINCYGGIVIINGGTITEGLYILESSVAITSGTFNFDPSEYVDLEKYNVTENEGSWIVTAK